jgi:tRNA (guanine-N7-)-methyltransferase
MNRPDPKAVESPALLPLRSVVERLVWDEIFPEHQPIEVDLGCGDGSFLAQAAKSSPHRNFLGVERLLGRARKAARKLERAGLTNARVLRIENSYAVQWLFPKATISAYHILFPDPWPKRRHWPRRLLTADFAAALHQSLAARGEVHLATDHESYFTEMLRAFAEEYWQRMDPVVHDTEEWRTDFEREFVKAKRPIFRARFLKRD